MKLNIFLSELLMANVSIDSAAVCEYLIAEVPLKNGGDTELKKKFHV